jgi:hypothetical protein
MLVCNCVVPPTATPSALTLIGSTGVCWMRIVAAGGGGVPAAGVILASTGDVPPVLNGAPVSEGCVPGAGGADDAGMPAAGVTRRATIPPMPPTSVPIGLGVPAGGVRRRGTMGAGPVDRISIGGGNAEPVPMSVDFEPPPRGGGDDPVPTGGGGAELALALASARARAASSITARADAGSADASVVWMSPGAFAASSPAAASRGGGGLDGGVDVGGALASPP